MVTQNWPSIDALWRERAFVAEWLGTLHRARKWWPCAFCIDDIAPGDRYWLIDGRRWCAWCVALIFDIAPEDIEAPR
jgi:hypothetical protein